MERHKAGKGKARRLGWLDRITLKLKRNRKRIGGSSENENEGVNAFAERCLILATKRRVG
jgi:hypothetical protein